MKKASVYTRSGDKGETSLVSGNRLSKSDNRIDLYGDVDELNSSIGFGLALMNEELEGIESVLDSHFFSKLQSTLFDLGSRLACESENWTKYKLPQVELEIIKEMESIIDLMDSSLEPMRFFILPGGSKAAAYFHVSRTTCRRVERKLVAFSNSGNDIPENSIELLNRLSDFLFVLSRYVNKVLGRKEEQWIPVKTN